jgi:hypothetical protein
MFPSTSKIQDRSAATTKAMPFPNAYRFVTYRRMPNMEQPRETNRDVVTKLLKDAKIAVAINEANAVILPGPQNRTNLMFRQHLSYRISYYQFD